MMKKTAVLAFGIAAVLSFSACGAGRQTAKQEDNRIKVSVTFNALREFAAAVGGDKVEITTIIPDGTEPHDFEPKARDLVALSSADVFVYNGLNMEPWAEDTAAAAGNGSLVAVDASKGAAPIRNTDPSAVQEHGEYDPHLWLSPSGAELEAKNIRDALIKARPADKDYFTKNCAAFVAQMKSLSAQYSGKFSALQNKDFVTGHAAFAYLCRDFGLRQNSVEDVFAEGEPSAKQLAELVDYCKKNRVKTVFVEEMVSPAVSQTLADSVGAKVKTIYTMESSEDGKTYLARMRENLGEIYDSLSQ